VPPCEAAAHLAHHRLCKTHLSPSHTPNITGPHDLPHMLFVTRQEIDRKKVGGFFGETALVMQTKRTATIKSLGSNAYAGHTAEAAEFFQLSRADFNAVVEKYPALKLRLHTIAEHNMKRVKRAQNSLFYKIRSSIKNFTNSCFKPM
jgi:hypothetical protein